MKTLIEGRVLFMAAYLREADKADKTRQGSRLD